MFSFKSIALIVAAVVIGTKSSAVPAIAAAPLVAPAHVGYAHAVPQNIPPYAAQINVQSRAALIAAPALAAPLAAPIAAPLAAYPAPLAARYAAPFAAAPYFAASEPLLTAPYSLPAPYPYHAATPLVRAPYYAPTFVR